MRIVAEKKMVPAGSLILDGYMFADGKFGLNQTQLIMLSGVTKDTKQASKLYLRIAKSKLAQKLVPQGFIVHPNMRIDGQNERVNIVELESIAPFLTVCLALGHLEAAQPLAILTSLGLQQLFCDAFKVDFNADDRQEYLKTLIPNYPTIWRCRYPEHFWLHLERLTTYRQGNIQCAFWINKFVYDLYPEEVRARLQEVNPLIDGVRKNRIHQHFKHDLLGSLQQLLYDVFLLMEVAENKPQFERSHAIRFRNWEWK